MSAVNPRGGGRPGPATLLKVDANQRAVVSIGSFDGVHLAHQELARKTAEVAAANDAAAVAVTFEPHPRYVLAPDRCPPLLTLFEEKEVLLTAAGFAGLVVIPFDHAFAAKSPREFMAWLEDRVHVVGVVGGYDFRFGSERLGTLEWLQQHGYVTAAIGQLEVGGRLVHSSAVRGLVESGEVGAAAELLGRDYTVHGEVVHGKARGRTLGYPTANLAVGRQKCIPGPAAYAGWARWEAGGEKNVRMAAISVGHQPTFGGGDLSVEAYLLDFDGDLYGVDMELAFVARLHPDTRYPSVEALVEQIRLDVEETRRLLTT